MRTLVLAFALVALFVGGCFPDLGTCDEEMARTTVFADSAAAALDGLPAYGGQALVEQSCGGGAFCHAPAATNRYGAPGGINFDIRIACSNTDAACDYDRLREAQLDVFQHRRIILREVDRGTMPPGPVGASVVETSTAYRMAAEPGSAMLPEIDSPEGQDILRNWLACGAPVVEVTEAESDGTNGSIVQVPGENCTDEDTAVVGDCRVRVGDGLAVPEPTWSSIYEDLIEPLCVRCHGEDAEQIESSQLDMGDPDAAYLALVNRTAEGEECVNMDLTRIVPGNADESLFVNKMTNSPQCGDTMPVTGVRVPAETLDVVRQWINDGAADN